MALKSHMSVCPDLWSGDNTLSCRTTPNEDNAVYKYTIIWLWLAFFMSVCPATDGFLGLCLLCERERESHKKGEIKKNI